MKFIKRVVLLLIMLGVIFVPHYLSHAQGNKPQPIYTGEWLAYLDWAADGHTILFTDIGSVAKSIH